MCPNISGSTAEVFPKPAGYKQERSTFLETALRTRNSNTCGLCFSDTLGIELPGSPNPLSYKTGQSVALSVCHWHTESADFFHLCLPPVTLTHLSVLLIINKANIACTKVRESCKSRLTTISPFPDTALYPFMKLFLPTLDNATFGNTGIFWTAQAFADWYSPPGIQKVGKANS